MYKTLTTIDNAGRMISAVDSAGRQTSIHYELDNKRVRSMVKELPDASRVTYEFDPFGRPTSMTDTGGTVRYTYDGFGRLTTVHRDGSPAALAYTYDTLQGLRSIGVGEQWTIHYGYDFLGRLAEIGTPVGRIAYEYYNGQGTISRTLPNGIRTLWAYRPDGNLESLTHVVDGNKVLAQFSYAYRPDGLLHEVTERSPQGEKRVTYTYDTMQRLIAVADSQYGTTHYHYDKLGNRVELRAPGGPTVPSTYDWAGRLVQHSGQETTHDAAGNLTSYVRQGKEQAFAYTPVNLLQNASTSAGKVQYQYDGNGSLLARASGPQTTSFLTDPMADIWRPLLAMHGQGKHTYYVWEGELPLAVVTNGEVQFLLHDHLESVRAIADRAGKIVRRFAYSPFGEPQEAIATDAVQPGFAGLFFDPHAGLYLTRARAYDARLARFLQRDPLLYRAASPPGDHATYIYCHGDPVNFVDRDGRAERAVTKQPFLDYLNGTEAFFQNGLALGVDSGTYSLEEIARLADGRFAVVVVWGNDRGPAMDLFRATIWDTAGGARQGTRIMPFAVGKPFVHHSAGNFIAPESSASSL